MVQYPNTKIKLVTRLRGFWGAFWVSVGYLGIQASFMKCNRGIKVFRVDSRPFMGV